jgi:hypothetical protein
VPDGAVGIRILCDLAATVGGRQNGSAPADRGYTGGRGWPPQNRAWPAPFGAAGGTGGKWRFDLPEIPQAGGRHPYPDPVQTAHRQQKGGISAATFYASDTLPALLFLEFVQMCAQDLPVTVCESCHRLFVPFSSRAKYCERMLDPETGATCKDIAAKLAYAEELKANKAKELYNKMRNRYQMRCSRAPDNQKMRDEYNAWRKQAQMALSKYQLGEISWAEFVDSLTCSSKAE